MPTVLKVDGFKFVIFTDDHEPAHVHVFKAGVSTVLWLGSESAGPSLRENKGMAVRDARAAVRICEARG